MCNSREDGWLTTTFQVVMWQSRVENEHYSISVKIEVLVDIDAQRFPPFVSQV